MEGLSPYHLLLVLIVALLVLGPGKLPEVGAALGKSIRSFREAMSDTETRPNETDRPPDA
jgi:sec-independent protein translocase protein TatA